MDDVSKYRLAMRQLEEHWPLLKAVREVEREMVAEKVAAALAARKARLKAKKGGA